MSMLLLCGCVGVRVAFAYSRRVRFVCVVFWLRAACLRCVFDDYGVVVRLCWRACLFSIALGECGLRVCVLFACCSFVLCV